MAQVTIQLSKKECDFIREVFGKEPEVFVADLVSGHLDKKISAMYGGVPTRDSKIDGILGARSKK